VSVDLPGWQGLAPAIQRRLLRDMWRAVAQSDQDLSWQNVEQARRLVEGPAGRSLSLPHGVRVQRGYTGFSLGASQGGGEGAPDLPLLDVDSLPLPVPGTTALPGGLWRVDAEVMAAAPAGPFGLRPAALSEDFDADVTGSALLVRRRLPGDRMQPLGMGGSRKVHDIMVDGRIARSWRASVPIVATAERVLWVVGLRRSDWGKVTATTQRVLRIRFVPMAASNSA
jgi:tRNA(Ile)-lysidine synthetase-like protein